MIKVIISLLKRLPFVRNRISLLKGLSMYEMIVSSINETPIIIDVGANNGSSIEEYISLFNKPQIYSFEPTPHLFNFLEQKYHASSTISIYNVALSDKTGEAEFFSSEYSPTNSLLEPNIELYEKLGTKMPTYSSLSETFQKSLNSSLIETLRFDDWYMRNLKGQKIDLFKTDTQGFDFEVLNGTRNALPNIKFIIVECQFQEFYLGSTPFYETFKFLYDHGFYLYNINKKNNLFQIFECDAIFINSRIS